MFVAIWIGGIGFSKSQNLSAEILPIATFTRNISDQLEEVSAWRII